MSTKIPRDEVVCLRPRNADADSLRVNLAELRREFDETNTAWQDSQRVWITRCAVLRAERDTLLDLVRAARSECF